MKIGNVKIFGIIYKIENKINNKIYIGQTCNDYGFKGRYNCKGKGIERVYNYHKKNRDNGKYYNNHLLSAIEKYGFENFKVTEIFDCAFSRDELNIKEITYIKLYNSYGDGGYNNTCGGEGTVGLSQDKYEKSKNSKKIIQLDLNGNFIKEWGCILKASEELNIIKSSISLCCLNKIKSAGGYNWCYYEDYINDNYEKKVVRKTEINPKMVVKLDNDYQLLKIYDSISDTVKDGYQRQHVSKCCNKKRKKHCGYIWMYYIDYEKMLQEKEHITNND